LYDDLESYERSRIEGGLVSSVKQQSYLIVMHTHSSNGFIEFDKLNNKM
jgi:hypothetical protein